MGKTVRAAIIQTEPVPSSLEATLDRLERGARKAAGGGARLIVTGEVFVSGYPAWLDVCPSAALWDHGPTKEAWAELRAQGVTVPGPALDRLSALATELGAVLVIGAHERIERGPGHGSVYAAQLTIDADGRLLNHHRKLVPTYGERLAWAPGDGAGLRAVDTAAGRVGGLICWEHWMPLARQVLHDEAEQIHVAAWPGVKELHQVASRHYAFEGRCFVLAAGSLLRAASLPSSLRPQPEGDAEQLLLRGGSAIYGPGGEILAGPVFDSDAVVAADLDLDSIPREAMALDVSGHYFRPDVFSYSVRRDRRQ